MLFSVPGVDVGKAGLKFCRSWMQPFNRGKHFYFIGTFNCYCVDGYWKGNMGTFWCFSRNAVLIDVGAKCFLFLWEMFRALEADRFYKLISRA